MRDLLDDLAQFDDVTLDALTSDRLRMLALERILTVLVDLAADINQHIVTSQTDSAPADYRSSFDRVARLGVLSADLADALAPSIGLRNVLVHHYADIDLEIVAASVPLARDQYARYVREVASWLSSRE